MTERDDQRLTLAQLLNKTDDPQLANLFSRVLSQFGGHILVSKEVLELIDQFYGTCLTAGQKAAMFHILTARQGRPLSHASSKLAKNDESFKRDNWHRGKRNSRRWPY